MTNKDNLWETDPIQARINQSYNLLDPETGDQRDTSVDRLREENMLVLTRAEGEEIVIRYASGSILMKVQRITPTRVFLGFTVDNDANIVRKEIDRG
jgi:sRNA-binding carbon storage regulator CsrA